LYQRAPQQLSKIQGGYNGKIDSYNACPDYHNIYSLCHIEVVLETNAYEMGWFTEKTTRCLYTGKPFLLMGAQGQIDHLRSIGFKTFEPWIDESYDKEPNTDKRFDLVQQEIRRIGSLSEQELIEFLQGIKTVAEYNKNNYIDIIDEYKKRFDLSHLSSL
jgi:hypothetical protein